MLADTYLRAVHCVVKLFGLTPFRHDCHNDAQPATPSKAAFAYAAIIGLAYNTFVCWSFAMLTGDSSDETVYVALHVKHVCKLAQSVGTFWSLFYYRLTLIESLNMAKRIRCQLASLLPAGALRDADTTRIVHNVLVWTMVQSGLTIGSMCVFAAYASMRALCFALIMFCSSFFSMVLTLLQFATILEVAQMYRALNKKLRTCVERIRQVSQMPRRTKMRMQMFCDVSDDVDKIAQLFKLVSLFNGQVCRVFSVSMLVNIVNSFAYALFAIFYLYSDLRSTIRGDRTSAEIIFFDISEFVFYSLNLYLLVWIAHSVKEAARSTGSIMSSIVVEMDERLIETIQLFSIEFLQVAPRVNICGMFDVDNALFNAILGTLVSFITILIQFQLAEGK